MKNIVVRRLFCQNIIRNSQDQNNFTDFEFCFADTIDTSAFLYCINDINIDTVEDVLCLLRRFYLILCVIKRMFILQIFAKYVSTILGSRDRAVQAMLYTKRRGLAIRE